MLNCGSATMLAHYKSWADKVIFDGVEALPPGEAQKERRTLFKTMIGTLNHIYVVDLIWRAHLEQRDHGFAARNIVLHAELAELWQAQQAMNEWLIAWSAAQTDTTMDEDLQFKFVSGKAASMTRGEIFLHLVTHASYHRGWVAEMFFDVPARPPQPDLSVFLTEAPQDWRKARS
jgi:uncharacterized damage-inducible protein DinB